MIDLQRIGDVTTIKEKIASQTGRKAMDKIRLLYGTLDFSLRSTRANIATVNRQYQSYLLWIEAGIDVLLIILILIATLFGLKNLKTYKPPLARLNSPTFGRANSPRQDGLIINHQCRRAQGARRLL